MNFGRQNGGWWSVVEVVSTATVRRQAQVNRVNIFPHPSPSVSACISTRMEIRSGISVDDTTGSEEGENHWVLECAEPRLWAKNQNIADSHIRQSTLVRTWSGRDHFTA